MRYHESADGVLRPCRAKTIENCFYYSEENPNHMIFPSEEVANEYSELELAEEFGEKYLFTDADRRRKAEIKQRSDIEVQKIVGRPTADKLEVGQTVYSLGSEREVMEVVSGEGGAVLIYYTGENPGIEITDDGKTGRFSDLDIVEMGIDSAADKYWNGPEEMIEWVKEASKTPEDEEIQMPTKLNRDDSYRMYGHEIEDRGDDGVYISENRYGRWTHPEKFTQNEIKVIERVALEELTGYSEDTLESKLRALFNDDNLPY